MIINCLINFRLPRDRSTEGLKNSNNNKLIASQFIGVF